MCFPLRQVRAETAYVFYTEYIYPQGGGRKTG